MIIVVRKDPTHFRMRIRSWRATEAGYEFKFLHPFEEGEVRTAYGQVSGDTDSVRTRHVTSYI